MLQSLLRLLSNEEEDSVVEQLDESEYKKLGEELLTAAWRTLNSPDWKLEKKLDNGDMVQVKQVNGKRVFKLTGYVEMAPRLLLRSCSTGSSLCPAGIQPLLNAKLSNLLMSTRTLVIRCVRRQVEGWFLRGTSSTFVTGRLWMESTSL